MITEKKKKIRRKPGQVFQVPLGNGEFSYGQVYNEVYEIFFDYKDDGKNPPLEVITQKSVLFTISVDNYVIREGIWPILKVLPIDPTVKEVKAKFSYDPIEKTYKLWQKGHQPRSATPEEIHDLECIASWGPGHVEQRLRDHFAGRPCYLVEEPRNRLNPNFERNIIKFYAQYGYNFDLESIKK